MRSVYHLFFNTSFGISAITYSIRPFLLNRVFLPCKSIEELVESVDKITFGEPGTCSEAFGVSKVIVDYFNGKNVGRLCKPWQFMATENMSALKKSVLMATSNIAYGKLSSYKEIASAIGRSRAYRFVGTALANNPFPILIPCHRVIKSNSEIGGFRRGANLKRKLIELEAECIIKI